jgi:hypothetical protein
MAALRHKLARLEQTVGELLPDQKHCPFCQGHELLAFSDEPDNVGARLPYDGPNGTCRLCRMPPPGTHILQLPAGIAEIFAKLPWSDEPRFRFIEKRMLLKAIATRNTQEIEREVTMLHARDADGRRHWRWTEYPRYPASAPTRTNHAETDPKA